MDIKAKPVMQKHRHLQYRSHIDGMRAIAVMGVVLFHFGASWMPGGFVGVDIFFVISGFVISKSLYSDLENGEFSIVAFYERRARRILPAFFATTVLTTVVATFLLFPPQLVGFAKSLMASAFSVSNIYFYATNYYFGPGATELPLLHYWSLSVEEQFYIVFPLLCVLVFRWRAAALPVVIFVLFAASLTFCEIVLRYDPTASFYLLPFRAFELLIGCLLASKATPLTRSLLVSLLAGTLGIVMMIGSMVLMSENMALPGLLSLIPCCGAALMIWSGENVKAMPVRVLSLKPILTVGKISYSLYLVHWPIVVFGKMLWSNANELLFLAVGVILSVALGWLSYQCIERGRIVRLFSTRQRTLSLSAFAMTTLIAGALSLVAFDGFPGRVSAEVNRILAYQGYDLDVMLRQGTCFLTPQQQPSDIDMALCLPDGPHKIVLWGDSSAAQYYWGLAPALAAQGRTLAQLTSSACAPLISLSVSARPNCRPFNDFALRSIIEYRPDEVVLGSVWNMNPRRVESLDGTIRKILDAGIKVVVLGPPSYYRRSVPIILAHRKTIGDDDEYGDADLDQGVSVLIDKEMRAHLQKFPSVKFVSVRETVCGQSCPIVHDGIPYHADFMHLTRAGSDYYALGLLKSILN